VRARALSRISAGFHINCLGLKENPPGDWLCPICKGFQHTLKFDAKGRPIRNREDVKSKDYPRRWIYKISWAGAMARCKLEYVYFSNLRDDLQVRVLERFPDAGKEDAHQAAQAEWRDRELRAAGPLLLADNAYLPTIIQATLLMLAVRIRITSPSRVAKGEEHRSVLFAPRKIESTLESESSRLFIVLALQLEKVSH
jgi:hypothetical protein